MNSNDRTISTRIRTYRMANGLSQEAFAGLMGVTPKTVRNLEQGGGLRAGTAVTLARVLGISLDDLLQPQEVAS